MMRVMMLATLAALAALPAAAQAPLQGQIGTVQQGRYVCELPGDAAGPRGVVQEALGFRIDSASRYSTAEGDGTYLRRGGILVFTAGPRTGEHYQVVSSSFLRLLGEDGTPTRLRCVRQGR